MATTTTTPPKTAGVEAARMAGSRFASFAGSEEGGRRETAKTATAEASAAAVAQPSSTVGWSAFGERERASGFSAGDTLAVGAAALASPATAHSEDCSTDATLSSWSAFGDDVSAASAAAAAATAAAGFGAGINMTPTVGGGVPAVWGEGVFAASTAGADDGGATTGGEGEDAAAAASTEDKGENLPPATHSPTEAAALVSGDADQEEEKAAAEKPVDTDRLAKESQLEMVDGVATVPPATASGSADALPGLTAFAVGARDVGAGGRDVNEREASSSVYAGEGTHEPVEGSPRRVSEGTDLASAERTTDGHVPGPDVHPAVLERKAGAARDFSCPPVNSVVITGTTEQKEESAEARPTDGLNETALATLISPIKEVTLGSCAWDGSGGGDRDGGTTATSSTAAAVAVEASTASMPVELDEQRAGDKAPQGGSDDNEAKSPPALLRPTAALDAGSGVGSECGTPPHPPGERERAAPSPDATPGGGSDLGAMVRVEVGSRAIMLAGPQSVVSAAEAATAHARSPLVGSSARLTSVLSSNGQVTTVAVADLWNAGATTR